MVRAAERHFFFPDSFPLLTPVTENHDDSKWRVNFIDPATRAKEKSSELWSNFQQRRKAFFELQTDAQADVIKEDMTFRRVSSLSAHSHMEIAGKAAAEEIRLKKLAANYEASLLEFSTVCAPASSATAEKISFISHSITGVLAASPALLGLLIAFKGSTISVCNSMLLFC
jgi:hypothetical protein